MLYAEKSNSSEVTMKSIVILISVLVMLGSAVFASENKQRCQEWCEEDQGICVSGCQSDHAGGNCVARCSDAYWRCVDRCGK